MANNWSLRLAVVYCGIIQLISLLILTYASSNLIYNIERIGLIIGTFDWYNHPPRVRRALLLIMNAGQKYRAITAGRFYPVTLAVFEMVGIFGNREFRLDLRSPFIPQILKSSISYYTILKNMYTWASNFDKINSQEKQMHRMEKKGDWILPRFGSGEERQSGILQLHTDWNSVQIYKIYFRNWVFFGFFLIIFFLNTICIHN